MYISWKNFNCPHCGELWQRRMVSAPVPDLEVRTCKWCHKEFATPDIEWPHMTLGQKIGYCISEAIIAFLIFYVMLAIMVGAIASDHITSFMDYVVAALVEIGIFLLMFTQPIIMKSLAIKRSKARVAAQEAGIDAPPPPPSPHPSSM